MTTLTMMIVLMNNVVVVIAVAICWGGGTESSGAGLRHIRRVVAQARYIVVENVIKQDNARRFKKIRKMW